MARPHTIYRTLAALILLAVMAAVCASLGNWQMGRAEQRDAIKSTIAAGRNAAPLQLTSGVPAADLLPWRPATATGTWRHDLTVALENRNYQGKPGYWIATPLIIGGSSDVAVLVLRGWLPRPLGPNQKLPDIPAPEGEYAVSGELLERVPRLFELWSWSGDVSTNLPKTLPDPGRPLPMLQNLDLDAYSAATRLKFMPVVLAQTAEAAGPAGAANATPGTQLLRDWPEPSLDSDKNRGYALQWYGFAAIAGIAWLVIFWRALRRRKPSSQ